MAHTVLIVEDSESIAPLEIALSALRGLHVRVFGNGRDALDFVRSSCIDLAAVVTDLHLPVMDGFRLIAMLRADSRYTNLPIVVLSGDSDPATPERLRLLGANAFFPKPYSPAKVRDTLEALLNGK